MGGSQRSRCSSEPSRWMVCIARFECTPKKVPMLPSARAHSMLTRPAAVALIPGQP